MKKYHIISFFLLFMPILVSAATSAEFQIEGEDLLLSDTSTTINIAVRNIKESKLIIAGGMLSIEDESCLEIENLESVDISSAVNAENNRFSFMNVAGIQEDTILVKLKIKSNQKSCKTKLKISNPRLAFYDGFKYTPEEIVKEIEVVNLNHLVLNGQNLKLSVDQTYPLQLYIPNITTINPNLISWSTGSSKVASIDQNGLIKANSLGNTTVEAIFSGRKYTTNVSVVNYMKGDVNHDGKITLSDVTLALRLQIGLEETTKYYLDPGDINENGIIDLSDVLYILRLQMNLIN